MSDQVTLALIGMIGAIIAGFFKMIDSQNKNQKELTKAVNILSVNSDKQTKASLAIAKETKQGNIEAKERNGHLGEQNVQITELIAAHTEKTIEAIDNLKTQHIDTQLVDKQVISKE